MNVTNWKIGKLHADAPPGFPFAILGAKKEIVAWVKTKTDAEFIVKAASRISGLADDSSRYQRLWLGQFISRRK